MNTQQLKRMDLRINQILQYTLIAIYIFGLFVKPGGGSVIIFNDISSAETVLFLGI